MAESNREQIGALLRRIEEVRGLSPGAGGPAIDALEDPAALVPILRQVVDDLERSHRRVIEINVQLVSLREVASSLVSTRDPREAARLVARYLRAALGFDQVGLLLADRERGVLTGTWAWSGGLTTLEVPLGGASGATRPYDLGSAAHATHDPARPPSLVPPNGHPLARVFALHRSFEAVWLEPAVGVLAVGRGSEAAPAPPGERARLETAASTLGPMLENARLVHELSRSQRFLADVLDSMPSALVAFGPDARALSLNQTAQDLLGHDEAAGWGLAAAELLGEEGEELIDGTLATGQPVIRRETVLRTASGAALPVRLTTSRLRDEHGHAYGALATFLDLTPLKAAEERARQMDQLAALGRFTSSVAHEIRNPLTGIRTTVQFVGSKFKPADPRREDLDDVITELDRIEQIITGLLMFARPPVARPQPVDVRQVLDRTLALIEIQLEDAQVRLTREDAEDLPMLDADPDLLQQVFLNLSLNAIQAMPEGGELHVATGVRRYRTRRSMVDVSFRDAGVGIPRELMERIFDPFFTTRSVGTGLGLSISVQIVRDAGGVLTAKNNSGGGATMRVSLPVPPEPPERGEE